MQSKTSNDHVVSVQRKTQKSRSFVSQKSRRAGKIRLLFKTKLKRTLAGILIQMSSHLALNSCSDWLLHSSSTFLSEAIQMFCGKEFLLSFPMLSFQVKVNIKFWTLFDRNAPNQVLIQTRAIVFMVQMLTWLCWVLPLMKPNSISWGSVWWAQRIESVSNVVSKVTSKASAVQASLKITRDLPVSLNFSSSKFQSCANTSTWSSKTYSCLTNLILSALLMTSSSCVSSLETISCHICPLCRSEKAHWMLSWPCTRIHFQHWMGTWPTKARSISAIVMCYLETSQSTKKNSSAWSSKDLSVKKNMERVLEEVGAVEEVAEARLEEVQTSNNIIAVVVM